jgi:hypothetical protein
MMTKEEMREGIRRTIHLAICRAYQSGSRVLDTDKEADMLLNELHSQNVVIKEEGELPENPYGKGIYESILNPREAFAEGQSSMLKAGYAKVSPLI